jgi:cysteine desulfurase
MSRKIYLDYAAATPMDPAVLAAMMPYFSDQFYNPSAIYLRAKSVKNKIEDSRRSVAKIIGAKPAEIVFTAGATEANNLAIQGVMQQFPDGEVLLSSIEHESVLEPAGLFKHNKIPVDKNGLVQISKLGNLINNRTVLISVMLVNNELGTIQPLHKIAAIIDEIRTRRLAIGNKRPLYLHTDAAQAGNYLDLQVSRLGADLISINGGKIYGPKQSGILYVKTGTKLAPQIVGGGQEFSLRSGTENVPAIVGLAKALELAQAGRAAQSAKVSQLRDDFEAQIGQKLPRAVINGSKKHRAPHISSLSFDGVDNERLIMELDERGIECAAGSACSASNDEPSHVLRTIGLSPEQISSSLRFSFGRLTSQADINATVGALVGLIGHNR